MAKNFFLSNRGVGAGLLFRTGGLIEDLQYFLRDWKGVCVAFHGVFVTALSWVSCLFERIV